MGWRHRVDRLQLTACQRTEAHGSLRQVFENDLIETGWPFMRGIAGTPIVIRSAAELAAATLGEIVEDVGTRCNDGIRRALRLLKISRRLDTKIGKA